MQVQQWILDLLDRGVTCDGALLRINEKLHRADYVEFDKVLKAAGGKWDRRTQAHVFDPDAAAAIEPIILTGEARRTKQEFGQFFTPAPIAELMVEWLAAQPGAKILEPSAGKGALAKAAQRVTHDIWCVETDPRLVAGLRAGGFICNEGDFLAMEPETRFDAVLMNPPFAGQADVRHVLHATRWLRPGGTLVAAMSAGVTFRQTEITKRLRALIDERGGETQPLPTGAFKASGTNVNAVLVRLTM